MIDRRSNIPDIIIEEKATLPMFSFFSSIGEMKNKKNKPLKANKLLAPDRKIWLAPFPNIGSERSNFSKSITNIEVMKILNKAIGTIIVLDFIIDFLPKMFATTATNRKRKIINVTG